MKKNNSNAIIMMGEEMPECPICGVRLIVSDEPVDEDEDGPIYLGICQTHGEWLLQDEIED